MSMTTSSKERHERTVFGEFAAAALCSEQHNGVESRVSPEPDIFFRSISNPRYFELGRLLDAEHSRTMLKALRQAPACVTPNLNKIKLPEREVLQAKLLKSYDSRGLPIELLLYFDAEHRHLEGGLPPIDFSAHAEFVMLLLLRVSIGAFSRVWVFERYQHSVLWQFEAEQGST